METHPFEKKKFPWLYSEIQFLFPALVKGLQAMKSLHRSSIEFLKSF